MNISDDMRTAVRNAELTLIAADQQSNAMAKLLVGRLRNVTEGWNKQVLKDLKKELREFNGVTGEWKS